MKLLLCQQGTRGTKHLTCWHYSVNASNMQEQTSFAMKSQVTKQRASETMAYVDMSVDELQVS